MSQVLCVYPVALPAVSEGWTRLAGKRRDAALCYAQARYLSLEGRNGRGWVGLTYYRHKINYLRLGPRWLGTKEKFLDSQNFSLAPNHRLTHCNFTSGEIWDKSKEAQKPFPFITSLE